MHLLEEILLKWQLQPLGKPIVTPTSILQYCQDAGQKKVLKIPTNKQEKIGCGLMAYYNGNGSAKVYHYYQTAILMEYIPSFPLLYYCSLNKKKDLNATEIIAKVILELHQNKIDYTPLNPPVLRQWFTPIIEGDFPEDSLYYKVKEITLNLFNKSSKDLILHGDIPHLNIGVTKKNKWVAIDPKAVIGPREFDYANILCNPNSAIALKPGRLKKHILLICQIAHIEYQTLVKWVVVWSALSALWKTQDNLDASLALGIAEKAMVLHSKIKDNKKRL
ncbi:aminoglycoside phosphotransferase family protein [Myroides sp. LJL115]